MRGCLLAAALVALLALILLVGAAGRRARFFTGSAFEEPTRSFVPFTGTVARGPWGARPWAEAAPYPAGC